MQTGLPHTIEIGYGVILNVASMAHRRSGPGHTVLYASAKGAVVTLAIGVAREFVDRGIRALFILPRPIDTAFQSISWPKHKKQITDEVLMKRMDTPEETAKWSYFCTLMPADL